MNRSLWQDQAGEPGVIRESPIPSNIADNEILVKVQAWAMNPADAMVQDVPLPFIKYPLILGEDVAGTVEKIGSAVDGFQAGDRVLGLALGAAVAKPEQGAFQEYVILDHSMACKLPDSLSFTEASVFPLCIATAAHGLFSKDYLGLPFPTTSTPVYSTGKSIFIWGGSSGVGGNAIQLCKAAGFEVFTTASARNFEYVKGLGADHVYDYNDPDVIRNIVADLDKGECVGVLQAAGDVPPSCQVAHQSKQNLRVVATNPVPEGAAPEGVEAKMIFASGGAVIYHETNPATFAGYLPEALAKGAYKVAPPPEVVPTKGLEGIQEALDSVKKGVSAKKLVTLAN
ncbi:zinc-binding alcohol dehydrogenase family protein [Aspergillus homomorphus CBS 101889]|uniref:Oxidoreductase n=1 Tax=Aspergillus homomorphus (strain CBS 101889) TaxID=1450537 RepID=A0A395HP33_ASPHC|nr:oxidoreductase [Aspergillus homomorphus CBS 101889]RAL09577.1 oxidoreductase [Aspergillus homomorphus CBS 101889]